MLSHFVVLYYKIKNPAPLFFSQFLFANQVLVGEREALVGAGKGEVSFLSLWPAVSHRTKFWPILQWYSLEPMLVSTQQCYTAKAKASFSKTSSSSDISGVLSVLF